MNLQLSRLFPFSLASPAVPWTDVIIREELFGIERLEQHAASLAEAQSTTRKPPARPSLDARLRDNASVLLSAYHEIAATVATGTAITPAAEWLLDNYHLVEAQIRQAQEDLPPRFYRQLPKLASGPFVGYPRVFGMAWACVAHSDSHFDIEAVRRFVRAYQQVQPLTIGELWALAISLRIVLVENLRRSAQLIIDGATARKEADQIADRLLGIDGSPEDPQALLRERQAATLPNAFIVQLLKRLRNQDPGVTPALAWVETHLAAQRITLDEVVRSEHQRLGASNVTVRNIITSMRLISDVDWPTFFEDVSLVDAVLRETSDFASMDFATRNLYRSAIEELARGSGHTELTVAHAAIVATKQASVDSCRARDPGYHLLMQGRRAFERSLKFRPTLRSWLGRNHAALGPGGYIAVILLGGASCLAAALWLLHSYAVADSRLIVLAVLGFIPAIDLVVALVNRAVMRGVGPKMLPGFALLDGIPAHLRTMVVVPTLLTTQAAIEAQLERLEVHYLSCAPGEIYFALLSDWTDADTEHTDGDHALLQLAVSGVAELNRKHGAAASSERFHLFHRRRLWSADQRRWIGWERKRGKLHELNRLLRGATDTTFLPIGGNALTAVPAVRYVVTLDADTRLPRESVRRLIGKLAHPLNRARFDAAGTRMVEGYAILQPRVTPSLPIGREGSIFQRVFSSMNGIDAYDAVVSDVYQDLFGAGSYAGKGIYDVDAFEQALTGRVPEGSLLSHDLLEGTYAHAGLVSDIEVVEEFPARYDVVAARNHRWARGDWQLLPWIFGGAAVKPREGGTLSLIGRWKMLDNLRRTLSAPTCVLALLAGWSLAPPAALVWTAFVLTTIALPPLLPVLGAIVPRRRSITARSHGRALRIDLRIAASQIALLITFLMHQAWLMTDAIARTLFRLLISQRNLLEWVTAAQSQLSSRPSVAGFYPRLSIGVSAALAVALLFGLLGQPAWWVALPFVVLWVAAPWIAQRISMSPTAAGRLAVSLEDRLALRLIARRTWRFFETFVTAHEHWLPPDNFQEDPKPVLARRTSPTNIGLYLLSAVSARDFGWEGTCDIAARLEATLATLHRLERCRGHFYNWYDTRDLRALDPHYVSAVDSGNLAAHFLAVANACREWTCAPLANSARIAGIDDALLLSRAALAAAPDDQRNQTISRVQLEEALNAIAGILRTLAPATTDLVAQLNDLARHAAALTDGAQAFASKPDSDVHADLLFWSEATRRSIESWQRDARQTEPERIALNEHLRSLEARLRTLALAMEFDFLLDPERQLLAIGYLATTGVLDASYYDLLASEARLASFFAIAKNDVPTRHWFRLGRSVTSIGAGAALISWSGSMFEYLMPSLVMRAPAGSLLEQTSRLIVRRQIDYGNRLRVPWGISESAYSARDLELTYQYSSFGVPGLGLKRGLSENVVIAPYATALAAMVDPHAAMRNFERLEQLGAQGRYGFYEALDYTRSRLPANSEFAIVRAFMAHHQGMTVVAIANVLFDGVARARFHAEPRIQAAELLLQERTPRDVSLAHPRAEEVKMAARLDNLAVAEERRLHTAHTATVQTHLLSNGRYAVMLTGAGSGYSRWRNLGITRWREDATLDDAGYYIYLRDVQQGTVWSAGYQPCGIEPESYEVMFSEDRAEFIRNDATLTTVLEVVVSPEDDAEVRQLSITNRGEVARDIDVTSYCELVLAPPAADVAHPAFSKLFVQTEYLEKLGTLLATRRRRSPQEAEIWTAHLAVVVGETLSALEFETDRARFLGRGGEAHAPIAVMDGQPLSNTAGTVLDPIFALRCRVRVPPNTTVCVSFWTVVADSRAAVLDLVDKHHAADAFARAATLAWTQGQVQLRHLGVSQEEAIVFQRLAGHVLYPDASMRPPSSVIRSGAGSAAALWPQSISGDLPIVLLKIDAQEDIAIVRQLLQAHEYWSMKQLAVDLVILNERASSYVQDLQIAIETLVRASQARPLGMEEFKGSVFVLRTDLLAAETRAVLSAVARVVLIAQRGSIKEQLERQPELPSFPLHVPQDRPAADESPRVVVPSDLECFNGLGGFADDGREYVTCLEARQSTPVPWINVIANSQFGFQVAVEGGGYTWSMNSRDNQLTPWSNDPVTDRPGEVLYVRDEATGDLWGPTASPIRDGGGGYCVRHGQGYSRFEHSAFGVALDLLVYVAPDDPIKICQLKLRNDSPRRRRLTVTAYVEWVLGTSRGASAPFIVTQIDAQTGAMFAHNAWNAANGTRVAFADLAARQTEWTGDRCEFLGRHGRLDQPAALLADTPLDRRTGAGLDPCCALQAPIELNVGATTEIVFFLGQAASVSDAQSLILRYRSADLDAVLRAASNYWDDVLGTVQVATPDRTMDLMLNRWLLYQTLVCRVWARSAFYQASGAYGFRDQLQDGMALAVARPALTREHLVRAAGRQFPEGDFQHWWLPPGGQGVRTRIADDRAWLAYTAAHYLESTGDHTLLDESIPFLTGAKLAPGEHDAFFPPGTADTRASFFEHCALALDASLELGAHGLPLIGTGDWNDGMNRVGEQGRGESVWLGWFLHATLTAFAPIAAARGHHARSARWLAHAAALQDALETQAWDGAWYRRGYFDDGTPFGAASSDECRIDSIAQSWSVLSGAAPLERATRAMAALDAQLIRRQDHLALLFTPPFDLTPLDPGYIKGYPPGIRENGGQYTHAAAWSVMAFAQLGDGDKAAELWSLLNPINRTRTRTALRRYKAEPYAVAADVYSVEPHVGRAGWTWYTGSAGWLYRAGVESLLGFHRHGNFLQLTPCIPKHWPGFQIFFRHASARYEITVENPNAVSRGVIYVGLDGKSLPHGMGHIRLQDDGATHRVQVTLG